MRAFLAALALGNLMTLASAYAEAPGSLPELCIVDVQDGQATEADIGMAYRMVFWTDVIPNLSQIYIQPLNRGGRWTIDREGRFREFDGIFPTRDIQRHWVADGSGRIIGANDTDLFVIDPSDDAFRHLLTMEDFDAGHAWKLSYLPHSETVFVETSRDLFELEGAGLVRSPFAVEASSLGIGTIDAPNYIQSIDAHLIESRSGRYFLRAADGSWEAIHTLACRGFFCRSYLLDFYELPTEGLVVVKTIKEVFAIDVSDARNPRVAAVYRSRANIWKNGTRLSNETGTVLIYDDDIFQRLSADRNSPLVEPEDSWLLRVTRDGFEPVPGAVVVPRSMTINERTSYSPGLMLDLPGWGQVLIPGGAGLYLFDGEAVRLVPDSGEDRLGFIPRPVYSHALDRLFVSSLEGLFELTRDDQLVELDTPFDATGYPRYELFDAPHIGAVIIASRDGIFTLDRQGQFRAVPGDHSFSLHRTVEFVGVLPETGDVLFRGIEALHLLTPRPCAE